jgi:hypothetical protein
MVERPIFHRLDPPASRGALTVIDVPVEAADPAMARAAAFAWAREVWTAWHVHHPTVRRWVDQSRLGG